MIIHNHTTKFIWLFVPQGQHFINRTVYGTDKQLHILSPARTTLEYPNVSSLRDFVESEPRSVRTVNGTVNKVSSLRDFVESEPRSVRTVNGTINKVSSLRDCKWYDCG
ncbi:hypothetical protein FACS18945_0270 [Bacteroidia bacterium]|nr:hypothetical protein FACS18945_0270 [Bacteroidia bacterium]